MTRVVFVEGPQRRRRRRKKEPRSELRRLLWGMSVVTVVGVALVLALRAPVRRIEVKESPVAHRGTLRQVLTPLLSEKLYLFDASTARAQLEADPWVADVSILRRLPGRVVVVLEAARPMFQLPDRSGAVDASGNLLPARSEFDLAALPVLRGVEFEQGRLTEPLRIAAAELADALTRVPWSQMLAPREVRWAAEGMDLVSALGMTIRLGHDDYEAKLRRLAAVESQLTPSAVIDLRFDRQVVLAPDAGPPPAGG